MAQTQVYKEKIHELEQRIVQLSSGSINLQTDVNKESAAVQMAIAQVAELTAKFGEQEKTSAARIAELEDDEKRLRENVNFLQSQITILQGELLEKDESLEKFSLSQSGIENLRRELAMLKEENEKQIEQLNADYQQKLKEKTAQVTHITAELTTLRNAQETLESERANVDDECSILKNECKTRADQIRQLNEEIFKLKNAISEQQVEIKTFNELKTAWANEEAQRNSLLEIKDKQLEQLRQSNENNEKIKAELESQLQTAAEALKNLVDQQQSFEAKVKEALEVDAAKDAALNVLNASIEKIKAELNETCMEKERLKQELSTLSALYEETKINEKSLLQQMEGNQKVNVEIEEVLHFTKETLAEAQAEITNLKITADHNMEEKARLLLEINDEKVALKEALSSLEAQSSAIQQELTRKVQELQTHVKSLETKEKAVISALEEQQQENELARGAHKKLVEELSSAKEDLEAANSSLNKLSKEYETLANQSTNLEEQLKKGDEMNSQRELELGDLTRKNESLANKCENLSKQVESQQADLLSARTTGSEAQTLMKQLNEEINVKQKAYTELESNTNSERLAMKSQIEELNQKLHNAQKEHDELKEILGKVRDEVAAKNAQIITLEEENVKQDLAISDATRQHENLQAKLDALNTQNETLQNDLTTLRTTSLDSNTELLKLSQEVVAKQKAYDELRDKTNSERATLEGQLQASQHRVDSLCSQVETLTEELKRTTEESFQRFDALKQADEKSSKQTLELNDLMRKLDALTAKCVALEQDHQKLLEDLNSTRTVSTDSNAKLVELTELLGKRQKEMQDHMDKTNGERLQMENQLQELQQRLQAAQNETESVRTELQTTTEAKRQQVTEFESLKTEFKAKAQKEIEVAVALETTVRTNLVNNFEEQLKSAEQTKISLDEAISKLQQQIKLLQEELLKSQLDFKAKEVDLLARIEGYATEKSQLAHTIQLLQSEGNTTSSAMQQHITTLQTELQKMNEAVKSKEVALQQANNQVKELTQQQNTMNDDINNLETEIGALRNTLELTESELNHKTESANRDSMRIEELKNMLDVVQSANATISATNAELSEALSQLEVEKCETANIFELFEMESDQNMTKLTLKLTTMKQDLSDALQQLAQKDLAYTQIEQKLNEILTELDQTQKDLNTKESNNLETQAKLEQLIEANAELMKALSEKEALLQKGDEFEVQLNEYKKVIDEMDESSTDKTSKLDELQTYVQQLEQELTLAQEQQYATKLECTRLERKLESFELDKAREIASLTSRTNGTVSTNPSSINIGDANIQAIADADTNLAQINFLNTIIADMQKKNDTLKSKIEALEAIPIDYTKPNAFDLLTKRKPAPRAFCDICDEFDKHETEDCPLQTSDDRDYSPPPSLSTNSNSTNKERKLPEPRKYCENCEVFGHTAGECADDETF